VEGCSTPGNSARVSKTETHVVDANGEAKIVKIESGATGPAAKALQVTRDRCAVFSKEQVAHVNELRWLAAEAGNAMAQNNLIALISAKAKHENGNGNGNGNGNNDAAKLFSVLQSSADAGHYEAFFALSRVYSEGVLVPADYVKSYAYAKAYSVRAKNQSDPLLASRINALSAHLNDDEKSGAEDLSKQIVSATN
jgi:hypothetical protein